MGMLHYTREILCYLHTEVIVIQIFYQGCWRLEDAGLTECNLCGSGKLRFIYDILSDIFLSLHSCLKRKILFQDIFSQIKFSLDIWDARHLHTSCTCRKINFA